MDAEQLLARAVTILGGGTNWTKFANARDINDLWCPVMSTRAVKWDIFGALFKAHAETGEKNWREYQKAYDIARSRIPLSWRRLRKGNEDLEHWNDYGDYASAVSVLGGDGGSVTPQPQPTKIENVLGERDGTLFTDSKDVLTKV